MISFNKFLSKETDMAFNGSLYGKFTFNTHNCIGKGRFEEFLRIRSTTKLIKELIKIQL